MSRRVVQSVIGAVACACVIVAPAQAGLLEMLFGTPSPPVYAPPDTRLEAQPMRPRVRAVRRVNAEPRSPKKIDPPEVGPGPLGPFVNDPTLRAGDVVVTNQGLKLFRGSAGQRHGIEQFVAIDDVDYRDTKRAADLASIQKVNSVTSSMVQEPVVLPPPVTVRAKPVHRGQKTASR